MRLGEFDRFYRRLDCGGRMIGVSIAGLEAVAGEMSSVGDGRAMSWADGRRDRVSGMAGRRKEKAAGFESGGYKDVREFQSFTE